MTGTLDRIEEDDDTEDRGLGYLNTLVSIV